MTLQFTTSYFGDVLPLFHYYKSLADRAIAQVTDEQLYRLLDDDANSIAIVMKHLAGNMRSRWADFLTADGEKPNRDRDTEFLNPPATRAALLEMWEAGCECMFAALAELKDSDLGRSVTIRGERHSVLQAVNRQVAHFAYHCGQIVLLAKHFQHREWKSLSVPKGASVEFNRRIRAGEASQR